MAALEEHLGAQLLRRTSRGLNLTTAGQEYFETASRISPSSPTPSPTDRAGSGLRGRPRSGGDVGRRRPRVRGAASETEDGFVRAKTRNVEGHNERLVIRSQHCTRLSPPLQTVLTGGGFRARRGRACDATARAG